MSTITRIFLVSILLLGCVGCDQVTKGVARTQLISGGEHSFLHDTLRLTYAENSGAFLSLGEALPDQIRFLIFVGGIGLLSLAAVWAALFARGLPRRQVVAVSLIASGGIGNWIDRLTNDGRVTDFLNVGIGNLRTGVFNVADMVLMAGVALYLLDASIRSRSAAR